MKAANSVVQPVPQVVDIHSLAIEQVLRGLDEPVEQLKRIQARLVEGGSPATQRLTERFGVDRQSTGCEDPRCRRWASTTGAPRRSRAVIRVRSLLKALTSFSSVRPSTSGVQGKGAEPSGVS